MFEEIKKQFVTVKNASTCCPLCGAEIGQNKISSVVCDALARDWELSEKERRFFDYREGCRCGICGATVRMVHLSATFLEYINLKCNKNYQFMQDIVFNQELAQLKIAEINNCGNLHTNLARHPNLSYSEFGSTDPGIRKEDLMGLSYKSNMFDIVLTSDVLEHVPDYTKALMEVKRVLKEDGAFIFTVPFLTTRKTLQRARRNNKVSIEYLYSPSYHGVYEDELKDYLVFYEFGYDFVEELMELFDTSIYCHNGFSGLVSSVFVCKKYS